MAFGIQAKAKNNLSFQLYYFSIADTKVANQRKAAPAKIIKATYPKKYIKI